VILRLAVLIQYRSVTDTQTHRHTTTANTALSIASRGKNYDMINNQIVKYVYIKPNNTIVMN